MPRIAAPGEGPFVVVHQTARRKLKWVRRFADVADAKAFASKGNKGLGIPAATPFAFFFVDTVYGKGLPLWATEGAV